MRPFIPKQSEIKERTYLQKWKARSGSTYAKGNETLWKAGYLILPNKFGVYALLALSSAMICFYMYILYSDRRVIESLRRRILTAITVSLFSFASAESYLTFVIHMGKNILWPNYVFMALYIISTIFLIHKRKQDIIVKAKSDG